MWGGAQYHLWFGDSLKELTEFRSYYIHAMVYYSKRGISKISKEKVMEKNLEESRHKLQRIF
jgi:hypothetical protein